MKVVLLSWESEILLSSKKRLTSIRAPKKTTPNERGSQSRRKFWRRVLLAGAKWTSALCLICNAKLGKKVICTHAPFHSSASLTEQVKPKVQKAILRMTLIYLICQWSAMETIIRMGAFGLPSRTVVAGGKSWIYCSFESGSIWRPSQGLRPNIGKKKNEKESFNSFNQFENPLPWDTQCWWHWTKPLSPWDIQFWKHCSFSKINTAWVPNCISWWFRVSVHCPFNCWYPAYVPASSVRSYCETVFIWCLSLFFVAHPGTPFFERENRITGLWSQNHEIAGTIDIYLAHSCLTYHLFITLSIGWWRRHSWSFWSGVFKTDTTQVYMFIF